MYHFSLRSVYLLIYCTKSFDEMVGTILRVSVNGSLIETPKISTLVLVPRPACLGIMLWERVSGSFQMSENSGPPE